MIWGIFASELNTSGSHSPPRGQRATDGTDGTEGTDGTDGTEGTGRMGQMGQMGRTGRTITGQNVPPAVSCGPPVVSRGLSWSPAPVVSRGSTWALVVSRGRPWPRFPGGGSKGYTLASQAGACLNCCTAGGHPSSPLMLVRTPVLSDLAARTSF